MKKEGLVLGTVAALSILLTHMINALGFNNYGYFGFGSFFGGISIADLAVNGLVLIIITYMVHFGVSRSPFGRNRGAGWSLSLPISILIMYGLYTTGFSFSNVLYNVGLPQSFLIYGGGILFIIGAFYLIKKIGFGSLLMWSGTILLLITLLTNWIYEEGAALVISIILILIGAGVWKHSRNAFKSNYSGLGLKKKRSKYEILILGILIIIFGAILGNQPLLEIGIIISIIGLIWYFVTRKKVQQFATSPATYKRPAQWAGKKYKQMTDPRYRLSAYEEKAAKARNKEMAALQAQQARDQEQEEKEMARRKLDYIRNQEKVAKVGQRVMEQEEQKKQEIQKEVGERINEANSKINQLKKLYDHTDKNTPDGQARRKRIDEAIGRLEDYIDELKKNYS